LLRHADALRRDGADRIDVGCQPGEPWTQVGDAVAALVNAGHRVSIDSFDPNEVETACDRGATLVLSVNNTNMHHALKWGTEVVVIPDTPEDLASLDRTVQFLERHKVAYRLDPILEPIGMGFAESLVRYHTVRRRYPEAAMMMGIGNLTELTDVDSAGVNMMLLGICAELGIESVLTTQVINWARSSVRECDAARRIVDYAVREKVPPKRVDDSLVMLRDAKVQTYPEGWFQDLAAQIRDNNYRLFAQDQLLRIVSANLNIQDNDPFRLFDALLEQEQSDNVDVSHAFYLGYELAKAHIALTLGKQYNQDQSLNWGCLTIAEDLHRLRRGRSRHPNGPKKDDSGFVIDEP
jgi:dihydropteroate synthase-like protein